MSDTQHHSRHAPHSAHRPGSRHHRGSERHGRIAHGLHEDERLERRETESRTRRPTSSQEDLQQRGPRLAAFCVLSAFLGIIIEGVNETVSHHTQAKTSDLFSVFSIILIAAALATGVRAQFMQRRRWSRRTNQRLWIGLPVAGVALIAVVPNFFEAPPIPPELMTKTAPAPQPPPAASRVETDSSLVKPGWYGELKQRNLMLVVSSYGEEAEESRTFNARLFKPVSYATLSVINLGCPDPVQLCKLEVELVLGSGERVSSLPIEPLLSQKASANSELLTRLALPRTIAVGEMLSDIPICLDPLFSWTNVVAVAATVGVQEIVVPGRVMTVKEKRELLDRPIAKPAAAPHAGPSAETWYKGM